MDFDSTLAAAPQQLCAINGGAVSYREAGSGPALVLLHGISSGSASWGKQLHELSAEYRVIAWDAPGYGASTPLSAPTPQASDYAAVLAQFVDALELGTFTLVGHSLGALMAAAYAHTNPQCVARLVLMSPAHGYAKADAQEREQRYSKRMAMLERLGPEGLARERASALVSANASDEAVACIAWNMRRLDPAGYRQAARMLAYDDMGRYATGYADPVAVISGEADGITPTTRCRAVADQFAASTYVALPGLGHALYLEGPECVNAFLRRQIKA